MSNELTQREIDELLKNITDDNKRDEIIEENSCPDCGILAPRLLLKSDSKVFMRFIKNGKIIADGGFPHGLILICLKCSGRFIISNETKIIRCN